jgi:uncharacterized iron-regulated membrane protein
MKMTPKKLIGKIHLWLGLLSGIVVFIVSITGAIYVFEEELNHLFYHDRYFVEVPENAERVSLNALKIKADAIIAGEAPMRQVHVFQDLHLLFVVKNLWNF